MKRDWDTIREILTRLEEASESDDFLQLEAFPSERAAEVSYHMELLIEAGLINGEMSRTIDPGPAGFFATRLTWNGHEFLDAARNETVWNKAMTSLKEKSMTVPFEVLKAVVMQKCREYFGVE